MRFCTMITTCRGSYLGQSQLSREPSTGLSSSSSRGAGRQQMRRVLCRGHSDGEDLWLYCALRVQEDANGNRRIHVVLHEQVYSSQ